MMPELKPCPKCKHWSRLIDCGASDDEALWHAECMNIGCQYTNLFESGDKDRVRTAWNDLDRPDGGDSLREANDKAMMQRIRRGARKDNMALRVLIANMRRTLELCLTCPRITTLVKGHIENSLSKSALAAKDGGDNPAQTEALREALVNARNFADDVVTGEWDLEANGTAYPNRIVAKCNAALAAPVAKDKQNESKK